MMWSGGISAPLSTLDRVISPRKAKRASQTDGITEVGLSLRLRTLVSPNHGFLEVISLSDEAQPSFFLLLFRAFQTKRLPS